MNKALKDQLHAKLEGIKNIADAQAFVREAMPMLQNWGNTMKIVTGEKGDAIIDSVLKCIDALANAKLLDMDTEYVGWQVQSETDTVISVGADDFDCQAEDIATVNANYFYNVTTAGVKYIGREKENEDEPSAEVEGSGGIYNPQPAEVFGGHPVRPPGA